MACVAVAALAMVIAFHAAAPAPAEAHHVQSSAAATKLQRSYRLQVRRQQLARKQLQRFSRAAMLQRRMVRMATRGRNTRITSKRARLANVRARRYLRLARGARVRMIRFRRAAVRTKARLRMVSRGGVAPSGADRAEVSADGTTIWYRDGSPLAHATFRNCSNEVIADIDGGDATNRVVGPVHGGRDVELRAGREYAGSRENLGACGWGPAVNKGNGVPGEKVTICHATGSATNPYVQITISVRGLRGHDRHTDDIIPAPVTGCPQGTQPPPPPPWPPCTITGAFVTMGDVDGIRVRYDEPLSSVTVQAATRVRCVVVRMCNAGLVDTPPIRHANGVLEWTTGDELIEWVDVLVDGAPVARRYESHAKCPYYSDPPTYTGGGSYSPPPMFPTLLEPVSQVCTLVRNQHAYLRSDSYRSIELRTCDGFSIRMYDDPMIDVRSNGRDLYASAATWPIGFGNGGVTLRDGTRVEWLLRDQMWTDVIRVVHPNGRVAAVTAFGHDVGSRVARATPVPLTDAQVREVAALVYRCRGSIANPLSCGGPSRDQSTVTVAAPATEIPLGTTTPVPVSIASNTHHQVRSFLDYSGSCAPSAWEELARPRSTRTVQQSGTGGIQVHPTRPGTALLCVYLGSDPRATADWGGASASAIIRVAASDTPTIGMVAAGQLLPGMPTLVSLERVEPSSPLRVHEIDGAADCASAPATQLVTRTVNANRTFTWVPGAAGSRRLCARQRIGDAMVYGELEVEVPEHDVTDLELRYDGDDALGRGVFHATGTTPAARTVRIERCSDVPFTSGGYSADVGVVGAFDLTTTLLVDPTGVADACVTTIDPATNRYTSHLRARFDSRTRRPAGTLRITHDMPLVGHQVGFRVADAAGPLAYTSVRLVDPGADCFRASSGYGQQRVRVDVPGTWRACATGPNGSWGERLVTFFDDPGMHEALPTPLRIDSGAQSTAAGSRAVVRQFQYPADRVSLSNYDNASLAYARVELQLAGPGRLTWTMDPGTHGCTDRLDASAEFAASWGAYSRSSIDVDAGAVSVLLGGSNDAAGQTFCVQVEEDDGDVLRARTVLFPRQVTATLLSLEVPGSVAPGWSAPVTVRSRTGSMAVQVYVHADASRPCQTLAAEEAGVGALVAYDYYVPHPALHAGTPPLGVGTWRVCAYGGTPWSAPAWFDTATIAVGVGPVQPAIRLLPTGAVAAGTLGPLARIDVAQRADGRAWVTAVPESTGCPASHDARPAGSIVLADGIGDDALVQGVLPAAGRWRLCAWQAVEVYTAPLAASELVVDARASAAELTVSALATDGVVQVGEPATYRVDVASLVPGTVQVRVLDDASACPADADTVIGAGAAAHAAGLPAGSSSRELQVAARAAGPVRACAWLADRSGRWIAVGSTTVTATAPAAQVTLTAGTSTVAQASSAIASVSWQASTSRPLVARAGWVEVGEDCTAPWRQPSSPTNVTTFDYVGVLPSAGQVRVCAGVGLDAAAPPLVTDSVVVDVAPLSIDIEVAPASSIAFEKTSLRVAFTGSANAAGRIALRDSATPCTSMTFDGSSSSAMFDAGVVDTSATLYLQKTGARHLCTFVTPTSGEGTLVSDIPVEVRVPQLALRIDPAAGPVEVGDTSAMPRVVGSTDTTGSLRWMIGSATFDCSATWPSAGWASLPAGPVSTAVATAPTTPGRWRICVTASALGVAGGFVGQVDVEVVDPHVDIEITPAPTLLASNYGTLATATWTSSTTRTLRGWMTAVAPSDPCTATPVRYGYTSYTGTTTLPGPLAAGTWRICTTVADQATYRTIATESVLVDVVALDMALSTSTGSAVLEAGDELAVQVLGRTNVPADVVVIESTGTSCPYYSSSLPASDAIARIAAGTANATITMPLSTLGWRTVCAYAWPAGTPSVRSIGSHRVEVVASLAGPAPTVAIAPAAGFEVLGEPQTWPQLVGSSSTSLLVESVVQPSTVGCTRPWWGPSVTRTIVPGAFQVPITPGMNTTGYVRTCIEVRTSAGAVLLSTSVVSYVYPPHRLIGATPKGRNVTVTGNAYLAGATIVVGIPTSGCTVETATADLGESGSSEIYNSGGYSTSVQPASKVTAGTAGCVLALSRDQSRVLDALPFTFG